LGVCHQGHFIIIFICTNCEYDKKIQNGPMNFFEEQLNGCGIFDPHRFENILVNAKNAAAKKTTNNLTLNKISV